MSTGVRPRRRSFYASVWRFFASVRLAIVLIFLIAVAALLGSLIQQEGVYPSTLPPELYYPAEYGTYGTIMFTLGFTRLYSSWWFLFLLVLIGINLTVCSIDRFVPLIRTLRNPKVSRSERFVRSRPVYAHLRTQHAADHSMTFITNHFKKEHYEVKLENDAMGYADKGRWGRYGPYVTHIGLMILLISTLGMAIPGWFHDEFFWVAEGETVRVPHTDFVVRNDKFTVEFYEDGRPKHFQTNAVIIENGEEVASHAIEVNKPFIHKRVNLIQASYQFELGHLDFDLSVDDTSVGNFVINVQNPASHYEIGDVSITLKDYFPHFTIDDVEGPITLSSDPLNPVFVLEIQAPDAPPVHQMLFVLQPDFTLPGIDSPYSFQLNDVDIVTRSGLVSHKNLALPYIYTGLVITVLGVFLSFYLYHRRVWFRYDDGDIHIGAMSNKHLLSLEKEMVASAKHIAEALQAEIIVVPHSRLPQSGQSNLAVKG